MIERILRRLGLWEAGLPVDAARDPPERVEPVIPPSPVGYGGQAEPWLDDPFPDYPVTTLSSGTGLTWRPRAGVRGNLTTPPAA